MTHRRSRIVLGVGLAAALGAAAFGLGGPAPAQEPAQKPIHTDVNVTLKLIQVAVTDSKGVPIADLAPADFEVTDNGAPVAVTQFERHFLGGGAEVPVPAAETAPALSRNFLMIFDFAFMDAPAIARARQMGLQFLDTVVQPGDEVSLVSYSPTRNLTLHEYMTTDQAKVRQIVEGFGLRNVAGRAENLLDYYLDQVKADVYDALAGEGRGTGSNQSDPQLMEMIRQRGTTVGDSQKAGYVQQAVKFSQALKSLALGLRYVAGTKHVLFFSNGIARQVVYGKKLSGVNVQEWTSLDQLASNLRNYDDSMPESAVRDAYSDMLDEFKRSNCQVYSFNEAKVRGEGSVEDPTGDTKNAKEMSGDDSLRQFASATGGRYFNNTVDVAKAMADVKSLTGAFYVLGYRVDEKWDGAYHKIKVKVSRPGANVEAQAGYYNLKPYAELTGFERLLHLMDLALAATPQYGLPIDVPLAAVPMRAGAVNLFSGRAFLPAETFKDVLGKRTEAFVFVLDGQRNVVSIKRFLVPPLPAGRDGLLFDFSLASRPGTYEGRIVLRNAQTGRGARGSVSFTVPEPVPAGTWSDPLLLLEEGRNTLAVSATAEISLARMYGYDPNRFFPRAADVPAGMEKVPAAVRCGGFGDGQDITAIATAVNPATHSRSRIPVTIVGRSVLGGANLLLLDLGVAGLAPGRYPMDVIFQSQSVGASAMASAEIVVK